eukprot:TRINITY_DN26703_c0_g1_i1.p2 TRINITY_DN26703_c0_g1~~TRINITY_DN26703_c0_g1_i1.p2  ORF type:complete len:167 (+),score=39.22 TRINITY_DN26703_c0_g1_i1:57-557(+)
MHGDPLDVVQCYTRSFHAHNSGWEIVREKKQLTTFRCRECQFLFKIVTTGVVKCSEFEMSETCTKGDECGEIHVFKVKQKLKDRVDTHGASVLARVPVCMRPACPAEAACSRPQQQAIPQQQQPPVLQAPPPRRIYRCNPYPPVKLLLSPHEAEGANYWYIFSEQP